MPIDPALVREVVSAYKAVCFELKRQLDPSTTREQILSIAPVLTEYALYKTEVNKDRPLNPPIVPDETAAIGLAAVATGEQLSKWLHSAANPAQRLSTFSSFCKDVGLDMASLNSWPSESVLKAVAYFNTILVEA